MLLYVIMRYLILLENIYFISKFCGIPSLQDILCQCILQSSCIYYKKNPCI